MNPRYIAYCTAHGNTPEQQAAADEIAYPGGRNCGFILWMSVKLSAYKKSLGRKWYDSLTTAEIAEFDRLIGAA